MALSNPVLAELANKFGIATEFWDWKGRLTEVSDETVVEILSAMGIDASTRQLASQALTEFENNIWRQVVPPCVVSEQGHGIHVNIHVNAGADVRVHIELEDGTTRPAWQTENWAPDRLVDGNWLGEATFWLGEDLPLGYHKLIANTQGRTSAGWLIITPNFVGLPETMAGNRVWGYATQLYSVRSAESWGIGDLTDLADLAVWASANQQAGYLLINPLYASQSAPPLEPSPYLPATRRYINPIYLRPEEVIGYHKLPEAKQAEIVELKNNLIADLDQNRIMRDEIWQAKIAALRILYSGTGPDRSAEFEKYLQSEGQILDKFATWSALTVIHGRNWRDWPIGLQDPNSAEVAKFQRENAAELRFYKWLQWVGELQLSAAQTAARQAGMAIGIVQDLPVGVDFDGAETWMLKEVFADSVTVGAPPDPFNQAGQTWGQPPLRPDKLAELGYEPFRAVVRAALRTGGGLRVDHIMGLFRLWWVPAGRSPKQGSYVRYDHEALVGILALEAYRADALIVGEDLGTVEPWVREYLARRGILGTSVLWFENDHFGNPLDAQYWREYVMSSVTTHDLPPTAGYLAGDHIRLRDRLGLLTEPLEEELANSRQEQAAWIAKLRQFGLLAQGESDPTEILLAMHRYIVQTPSKVLNVALTDAVGDRLTQNQPGTIDEYPNWRVPLSHPDGKPMLLAEIFESKLATQLAAIMNQ